MTLDHIKKPLGKAGACAILVCLTLSVSLLHAGQDRAAGVSYTEAQAAQGKLGYEEHRAECHGFNLEGFGLVPSLSGSYFAERWGDTTADQLALDVQRMLPDAANSLGQPVSTQILAYVLQQNGIDADAVALPQGTAALSALVIPTQELARPSRFAPNPLRYYSDGPLVNSSRLLGLRPVTDDMLLNPPDGDWLNWRRTRDSIGHSPLDQITKDNVNDLQLAWSWSLPEGANMMAPIVHDGVLFAYSFGDVVQAIDAATGDLLWGFQRELDGDDSPDSKKGAAIYGDNLVVATSDMHLVAIDVKTGQLAWDHKVDTGDEDGHLFKSAPLIANGKAVIGLTGRQAVEGGDFILAVDIETGEEVWRFYTIARPDGPGGDTWNGLVLDERTGGSVWIPGSYDAELNLVYFGPAPTYDTESLRQGADDPRNNDALYTNATVALDADTGELAWHYQHAPNDQLDHDWAFERTIVDLPVDGEMRRVVVTGGKLAIFEAMDAATGEYLFSIDLDMQNVVATIDPTSGSKSLSPAAIPAQDDVLSQFSLPGICPDWLGARNMQSTAYNPATRTLYIPLSDTCLDDDTGDRWQKYPDRDTDGSYGVVKAVNLETREVVWTKRQSGPPASANMTTDTGLLFIGSVDRWFKALNQNNGEVLWERRLDNALNSYPVTYRVDGKQYVAVATNTGGIHTRTMRNAAQINLPPSGATLWVFALPDR